MLITRHRALVPVRRLAALAMVGALLFAACSARPPGQEPSTPPPTTPGAGPNAPEQPLDCERLSYPCSLADTPPELLQRNLDLLAAAGKRLHAGTMADALAFLQEEPDVVEAFGSDLSVTFRIEGAPPAWLVDHSDVRPGETSRRPGGPADPMSDIVPMPDVRLASVVGEDTTSDGNVDNRDDKRALVLAPYLWQFAPYDESDHLAERLEAMEGYEGNVRLRANRTRDSREVTVDDWRSFDQYDAIFISTHGYRHCYDLPDGTEACKTVVMTGVKLDAQVGGSGFAQLAISNQSFAVNQLDYELGMIQDSFRQLYPEGLDDTLMSLSACETGLVPGDVLAAAMSPGGDDFVLFAWTEAVPADAAFRASGVLIEQLSLGLTSEQAYQAVIEAGYGSVVNKKGAVAALEHISPGGGEVRLVELPTLEMNGQPMLDGANLSARVIGTPGDFESDKLRLDLRLIGIHDKSRYSVRYEVDGDPTDGPHDLFFARDGDLPYSYVVQHEVDVGFGVPMGEMELTAIVDLPEGRESRYSVKVNVGGGVTITVGGQTWEFVLYENVGGCGGDENGFLAFGAVNGDAGGVTFSADLRQGGNIEVSDHVGGAKWMANADRATMTLLNRLPAGQSQIDEITIEGSRARGTATFIDTLAVRKAHSTGGSPPLPIGGTFDIQCTTN